MKTMSVRDVGLKWAETERTLARGGEIIVTRDSKPVARLLPYGTVRRTRRSRFDPRQHERWLKAFWRRRKPGPSTDDLLLNDRHARRG